MAETPEEKRVRLLKEALELAKKYQKLTGDDSFVKNLNQGNQTIKDLENSIFSTRDALNDLNTTAADARETFTRIVEDIKSSRQGVNLTTQGFRGLTSVASELQSIQSGITEADEKGLDKLEEKAQKHRQTLELSQRILASNEAEVEAAIKKAEKEGKSTKSLERELAEIKSSQSEVTNELNNQGSAYNRLLIAIDSERVKLGVVNDAIGLSGALIDGLGTALDAMGFGKLGKALGLDEASKAMSNLAYELTEGGTKAASFADQTKIMAEGFRVAGSNLVKNILDPMTIFTFLINGVVKAFKGLDEVNGKVAKNFGISYNQAAGITDELEDSAQSSLMLSVTTKGLTESFMELNNQYGTFGDIGEENLIYFEKLTNVAGQSAESAKALMDTTFLTGKGLKEQTVELKGTLAAESARRGLMLNQAKLFEEIKNASAATKLTLGGSASAIGKAVVAAKALGADLKQVEQISSSLLQFESSISNELEAELLTGKQLNLEKARSAALNGDLATVADEIANQIGSAADFTKMNVIQQEALAKSVGMTREDLAKSLTEREAMAKLSGVEGKNAQERYNNLVKQVGVEEARKRLGNETLADQLQSQSVQEKFAATQAKLQEVFVSIAEAIMPVVKFLGDALALMAPFIAFVGDLATTWVGLGVIISGIALLTLPKLIGGVKGFVDGIKEGIDETKDLAKGLASFAKDTKEGGLKSALGNLIGGGTEAAGEAGEAAEKAKGAEKIDPKKMSAGLKAIGSALRYWGQNFGKIALGSLALIPASLGLVALLPAMPTLFLLQMLKAKPLELGLKAIGKGLGALGKTLMGPQAAAIGLGLVLIAGLGAALIPLAYAVGLAAPAISAIGDVLRGLFEGVGTVIVAVGETLSIMISTVADSLIKMATPEIAIGLMALAPALFLLGPSLIAFAAGLTYASVAMAAASLLGNPFDMLFELATIAPNLGQVSSGIMGITQAVFELSNALASIDTDKLETIMNPSMAGVALGLGAAAVKGVTETVGNVASTIGGTVGGDQNNPVVAELKAVKEVLNQILDKEGSVQIDSTKAGTAFAMGSSKMA